MSLVPSRPLHALPGPVLLAPVLLAVALLSACGPAIPAGTRSTPAPPRATSVRQAQPAARRDPKIQNLPGLEGVIGVTEPELVRQFGKPRLEEWEGDVRKLQFTGTPCLLDVYLYPTSSTRTPVATYVDARRASDGRDVDRAACVAALRQR